VFLMGCKLCSAVQQLSLHYPWYYSSALLAQVGVGVETPNRYDVLNSNGQRIYFAAETSGMIGMQFSPSGPTRPFKIIVVDFAGRTILHIERPWNCKFCCLSCCNFCGTSGTVKRLVLASLSHLN